MFKTEIYIKGYLDPTWVDWFGDLQVRTDEEGNLILFGNLPDRSAVYGVISRLSSLGITLISVQCNEERNSAPLGN